MYEILRGWEHVLLIFVLSSEIIEKSQNGVPLFPQKEEGLLWVKEYTQIKILIRLTFWNRLAESYKYKKISNCWHFQEEVHVHNLQTLVVEFNYQDYFFICDLEKS